MHHRQSQCHIPVGSLQLLVFISFNLNNSREQVLFFSFCICDGAKTINVRLFWNHLLFWTTKDNPPCCSLTKWCPTLCNPVDCSTLDFLVLHFLPEFAQIHVH